MSSGRYVLLCGGVGGAKFALGLSRLLGPRLTVITNTGDDFVHLGLHISPDLDTVLYTLADVVDMTRGWGRRDETWAFMDALTALGGETWFRLGDRDLATHVERSRRLADGEPLGTITADFRQRLGVEAAILPMSDTPVATLVDCEGGKQLAFQDYFVRRRAEPSVTAIRFGGAAEATPPAEVLSALAAPELAGVFIAPSNPWLSIDPILAVPPLRAALDARHVPVVAVSPIVGGRAIKGPTAKIMAELGLPASAAAVAGHYRGLLDGFILDSADAAAAADVVATGAAATVTDTVMNSLEDRIVLARHALDFVNGLRRSSVSP